MRIVRECGCKLVDDNNCIEYCSMHSSAPDMYQALKQIQKWLLQDGKLVPEDLYNQQFIKANDLVARVLAQVRENL